MPIPCQFWFAYLCTFWSEFALWNTWVQLCQIYVGSGRRICIHKHSLIRLQGTSVFNHDWCIVHTCALCFRSSVLEQEKLTSCTVRTCTSDELASLEGAFYSKLLRKMMSDETQHSEIFFYVQLYSTFLVAENGNSGQRWQNGTDRNLTKRNGCVRLTDPFRTLLVTCLVCILYQVRTGTRYRELWV